MCVCVLVCSCSVRVGAAAPARRAHNLARAGLLWRNVWRLVYMLFVCFVCIELQYLEVMQKASALCSRDAADVRRGATTHASVTVFR